MVLASPYTWHWLLPTRGTGCSPPVRTGYSPPVRTGYSPPVGTGYSPPVGSGYFPPVSTGYSPPVGTGYSPPVGTGYSPPVGTGYSPPVGTGYSPPVGSGYSPPAATDMKYLMLYYFRFHFNNFENLFKGTVTYLSFVLFFSALSLLLVEKNPFIYLLRFVSFLIHLLCGI